MYGSRSRLSSPSRAPVNDCRPNLPSSTFPVSHVFPISHSLPIFHRLPNLPCLPIFPVSQVFQVFQVSQVFDRLPPSPKSSLSSVCAAWGQVLHGLVMNFHCAGQQRMAVPARAPYAVQKKIYLGVQRNDQRPRVRLNQGEHCSQ